MVNCFDQPSAPILGIESVEAAAQRMQRAIGRLRSLPAVVISHGRIISADARPRGSARGLRELR